MPHLPNTVRPCPRCNSEPTGTKDNWLMHDMAWCTICDTKYPIDPEPTLRIDQQDQEDLSPRD